MAGYYDAALIRAIAQSDRPLRHRDLAALLAPGDMAAWSQIGMALTHLSREGRIDREKIDGRYWHYRPRRSIHMRITQVTVSYGETVGLPEYSNVKPLLTLTATVNDGDDPAAIEADLWQQCRAAVQAQADATLEQNDRPAKYDPAPRYQVLMTYWDRWGHPKGTPEPPKLVVILPTAIDLKEVGGQRLINCGNVSDSRKLRYAHAMKVAQQAAAEHEATLLDCSDGDLGRLEAALPTPTIEQQADAAMDAIEQEREEAELRAMDDGPGNAL